MRAGAAGASGPDGPDPQVFHGRRDALQQKQEEQYEFPYHYIPDLRDGSLVSARYWGWSHRYIGGMEFVLALLGDAAHLSLIDVGCGDGRFLKEVMARFPGADLLGVDYSERAIELARAMNPGIEYLVTDIRRGVEGRFDIATLIEVLEHIPPAEVDSFISGVARTLRPGGRLILTVPHANQRVADKHYQHFTSDQLRGILSPHFREVTTLPFDRASRVVALAHRALGGSGRHYVVTSAPLKRWFYTLYRSRCLQGCDESECTRIATVCRFPYGRSERAPDG